MQVDESKQWRHTSSATDLKVLNNHAHPEHPFKEADIFFDEGESGEASEISSERACLAIRKILDFITDSGRASRDLAGTRAFIVAWSVIPELRKLKQTQLASLLKLRHKQSVGREVSKFRDVFGLMLRGMHSEEARESCRRREARKVEIEFQKEEKFHVEIKKEASER